MKTVRSDATTAPADPGPDRPAPAPVQARVPAWELALRVVEHLGERGQHEAALAALDFIERELPEGSGGRNWVSYHRARVVLAAEGMAAARPLVEQVLAGPLTEAVKIPLRAELIRHLAAAEDREALRPHLEAQLARPEQRRLFQEAWSVATRFGLFGQASLATSTSFRSVEVLPSREIHWPRPAVEVLPRSIEELVRRPVRCPATAVRVIDDCRAVYLGGFSFFFDADDRLVAECSDVVVPPLEGRLRDLVARAAATAPVPGTAAHMRDRFTTPNYCHWLLDWLPRLQICARADPDFQRVVCDHEPVGFERGGLDLAGYGEREVVAVPLAGGAAARRFERLLVPDNVTRGFRHPMQLCDPLLLRWWREHRAPTGEGPRRIYIPRRGKRCVLNEEALCGLLRAHGFEIVDPAGLDVAGQAAAFGRAEAVVAGHGAGLTNLLFAPSDCRVLELFPPRGGSLAFYCLATAIGQDYTPLVAPGGLPGGAGPEPNNLSFEADLEAVRGWLAAQGL